MDTIEKTDEISEDFPTEIEDKLKQFHESVENIENAVKPLLELDLENEKISPLDKVRLYLTFAYTMNSLFWMTLVVKGENPKEHPIRSELDRIKMYMVKMKELEDKDKAPRLDKEAAKMFVRSSLWEPSTPDSAAPISNDLEQVEVPIKDEPDCSPSPKRKADRRNEKTKKKRF